MNSIQEEEEEEEGGEEWQVEVNEEQELPAINEAAPAEGQQGDGSGDASRVSVVVLVLGDVGRSPRMQYHALSLAANGFHVDLVGYKGSRPHEALASNPNINLHLMEDVPNFGKYLPNILKYGFKVIWQSIVILGILMSLLKPKYILVQNPPSIPSLGIVWLYCCFCQIDAIIDWHNYGFTILGLTLGPNNLLVKICRWSEGYFGSKARFHLCVTKALQEDLKLRWNIEAKVLYDKPPAMFRAISVEEKHDLFLRLKYCYPIFGSNSGSSDTRLTELSSDGSHTLMKPLRPALVISSTSWTEDEDFSLLLDALQDYDSVAASEHSLLPQLIVSITGKGPLKSHYEKIIAEKSFRKVEIVLPWLEPEDYPKLLAASDLGVCLHTSSSSLDLPMKVVDMFGCSLPVCAIGYKCLSELVQHGVNGLHFDTCQQLSVQLQQLLRDFPAKSDTLQSFRDDLQDRFLAVRWEESWRETALPIFEQ